jgi:hypothetical protein
MNCDSPIIKQLMTRYRLHDWGSKPDRSVEIFHCRRSKKSTLMDSLSPQHGVDEEGLQTRTVAMNAPNKQSQTACNGLGRIL